MRLVEAANKRKWAEEERASEARRRAIKRQADEQEKKRLADLE